MDLTSWCGRPDYIEIGSRGEIDRTTIDVKTFFEGKNYVPTLSLLTPPSPRRPRLYQCYRDTD